MTQEEIWIPGSIFRLDCRDVSHDGQECEFLGWDNDEDNLDEENYDYRLPSMKFKDGYIEGGLYGKRYEFLHHKQPFYCKSLL